MKNLFYFSHINSIGGIEQFFAYLADKYREYDITIVYRTGDPKQIARLRKYVRVVKFSGQLFTCDRAFFCFNSDIRDFIEAKETALVLHGDYLAMVEQGQLSKDCYIFTETFDKYYGVSKTVCDSWEKMTGKKCELVYNPIVEYPKKKLLRLVYCGRLTQEKGGNLVQRLLDELKKRSVDYQLFVYSNQDIFKGDNVFYLNTRLDASQFLTKDNYDYILVLSKNEGYCYSLVQALYNGLPAVVTPCPVFKELGVNKSNSIQLEFNGSNIEEVIDSMLQSTFNFKYTPKEDSWNKILQPGKTTYEYRLIEIRAVVRYYDIEEDLTLEPGDVYTTSQTRANYLIEHKYAVRV